MKRTCKKRTKGTKRTKRIGMKRTLTTIMGTTMLDHTSMTSMIWDIYGKVTIGRNSTWVVKVTFVY